MTTRHTCCLPLQMNQLAKVYDSSNQVFGMKTSLLRRHPLGSLQSFGFPANERMPEWMPAKKTEQRCQLCAY